MISWVFVILASIWSLRPRYYHNCNGSLANWDKPQQYKEKLAENGVTPGETPAEWLMTRQTSRTNPTTAVWLRAHGVLPKVTKPSARRALLALVDRFEVSPSVPPEIHEEIEALKQMHASGVANYLLFRMAEQHCYLTMELVLRIRAQEESVRPRARTLEKFFQWARDLGLFGPNPDWWTPKS